VFISHDLSLIRYMCDRTAIMYLGDIIEQGPTDDVVMDPKHPYTEALFDAVPEVAPDAERHRANVTGEVPNPRNPPSGCRFHPRCSKIIPPEGWTGGQPAFRRAFQFKRQVVTEQLGPDDVDTSAETAAGRAADELLEHGLALELPEEHQSASETGTTVDPQRLDLPNDAERTLREAAERVVSGDYDAAREVLDGEFETVCARDHPELRTAGDQITACHLYDGERKETRKAPSADD